MTDAIAARTADRADAVIIGELCRLARAEAEPQRGGVLLLTFDGRDIPSDPDDLDVTIVVGEIDGVVVGYGVLRMQEQGSARVGFVEELFVHPEARQVGVAAAMLKLVTDEAVAQGATHLESEVLPGNRAAKNFFERMGMVTRKMRVSTPLTQS